MVDSQPSSEHVFPFGRPSSSRGPRRVAQAEAFVLGVYPSAFHGAWRAPDGTRVRALAVDAEPWPFWRGEQANDRLTRWRAAVEWDDGRDGEATDAGSLNGSSGDRLDREILHPLGIDYARCWLTDAAQTFYVHRAGQGTAVARYNRWARAADRPAAFLPPRPAAGTLVAGAISQETARLRGELLESGTRTAITLGNEALAVLRAVLPLADGLPPRLSPDEPQYGQPVAARIDGRTVDVIALAHPGQRLTRWRSVHERWMTRAPRGTR